MSLDVARAIASLLDSVGIDAQVYSYDSYIDFGQEYETRYGVNVQDPFTGTVLLGITSVAPFDYKRVLDE